MAVKDVRAENEQLNRFWPRYRRHTLFRALGLQFAMCLITIGVVLMLYPEPPIGAWIVIGILSIMGLVSTLITTMIAMRPVKELSSAMVHVSGEPSNLTPPNMNDGYYARNKMRPLLKQIYEMASVSTNPTSKSTTEDPATSVNVTNQLNHTSTGIVMLDSNSKIIFANSSAPISVDKDGNRSLELIFDVDQTIEQWLAERGDHDIHAEKCWRRISNKITGEPDRRIFDVHVSYAKGSEAETIITLLDRTKEYVPEDDDLDFIAFAAHELRGPITVIRGYLDTLNDELADVYDADQKELFQRLIVSANRLSGYVNNILNASRFDRRHLKIHISEEHLPDIYATIADDMKMRAEAQQRLLSVSFPDTLPTIAADLNSMGEVLANLIDNAIKYSNDGGSIEISAEVDGDFVQVSVTDHGIGMPANVISSLFHKFYRSHRSRETVAGTGIGLYITKAIVESSGGKISVRSVEGHGSTFTVSLPIYATVADKLTKEKINNGILIERSSSGWIKNHGAFRG
ncbi:HAMP domain-containing histidine kinase [Candidatus Saccharibacteria bacterium]|nr:HAMP domain-containing histidine kinase [Candidatus Saccharibacteria bacterium]